MAYASVAAASSLIYGGLRSSSADAHPFRRLPLIRGGDSQGRKFYKGLVVKAASDGSDSSSGSIVKVVQNAWTSPEDRLAIFGVGFAAIAAFWAASNLFTTVDSLPVLPNILELIGIWFSWWFIYRYLLFKPDREELSKNVKGLLSDVFNR